MRLAVFHHWMDEVEPGGLLWDVTDFLSVIFI